MTAETKSKADAFVNGQRVRGPQKARADTLHYNEKIYWFRCVSPGILGERGMAIDPSGGGARDALSASSKAHDQRINIVETERSKVNQVAKWRQYNAVWSLISPLGRHRLDLRYKAFERQHSEVVGLRATFGDLAGLAWELCGDTPGEGETLAESRARCREELRRRLGEAGAGRDKVIDELRRRTESANRAAHLEWIEAERTVTYRTEFGP